MRTTILAIIAIILAGLDYHIYYIPREILMVDPRNLGAKCDGKQDDTEGFQKASEAASMDGQLVMVPDGCWIKAVIAVPAGLTFQGALPVNGHAPVLHTYPESSLHLILRDNRENKNEAARKEGSPINYRSERHTPHNG